MDISARLQQLEELVQEAKSMPLSASVLVNKEEVLELLQAAIADLPEEIKQARWVVKDREDLLAKGRKNAEGLIERAKQEQIRLVSEQQVVQEAMDEAERILGDAREQGRQIRLEAEDYVDAKLAQYEIALERTRLDVDRSLAQVQRGRDKLRGAGTVREGLGEDEEAEEP